MKVVKSLLLGAAAGIASGAGAQAADLPVKAAPVQYVKICSLYGVGFYYIPGTDMCIKIGGWIRAQYDYGMNGSTTAGPFNANTNDRFTSNSAWRTRGYITADARNQTDYGTVRAYVAFGVVSTQLDHDEGATVFQALRGFIQWAGFTFGQAQSFFDFYSIAATSYLPSFPASSTAGSGWMVAAYTAQFGNGFSGSISLEQPRSTEIIGQGATAEALQAGFAGGAGGFIEGGFAGGFGPGINGAGYGGFQAPDVVGNLRLEQAWGAAQVMGAWHQVNTTYYSDQFDIVKGKVTDFLGPNGLGSGHPSDESGWAIGAGLKLNAPMIGPADYLQTEVNYTQGALGYVFAPGVSAFNYYMRNGDTAGFGIVSDAVFGGTLAAGNATDLSLTTAWNVNAAFEHHWNERWQTSVYGGYAQVSYDDQANAIMCNLLDHGAGNGGVGTSAVATPGCDNDWSMWWIGSRTQWNITKDLYMGVDVMYEKLNSASMPDNTFPTSHFQHGDRSTFIGDQDNVAVEFRVHKDFYP